MRPPRLRVAILAMAVLGGGLVFGPRPVGAGPVVAGLETPAEASTATSAGARGLAPVLRPVPALAPGHQLPGSRPLRGPTVATAADAATQSHLAAAGQAFVAGDYPRAQALFEQAATGTSGRARFEYWLLAAETARLTGRTADVERLLGHLKPPEFRPDTPRQRLRLDLLRAEMGPGPWRRE